MDKLATTLPAEVTNNVSIEAAELILNDLLTVTPVDTSKALSNWQASLDVEPDTILPAYYPGAFGSTAIISREAALEAAQKIFAAKKPGQRLYISNLLPYIRRLNDGSSDQAPAGFIERAVLLGRLFSEDPNSFVR